MAGEDTGSRAPISRRQFMRTSAAVGIGGLAVGGVADYLLNDVVQQSGESTGPSGGAALKVVGINARAGTRKALERPAAACSWPSTRSMLRARDGASVTVVDVDREACTRLQSSLPGHL